LFLFTSVFYSFTYFSARDGLASRPDSAMAQEWCLLYGILSAKEAIKLNAIVSKRKAKGVTSAVKDSPIQSSSKAASASGNKRKKQLKDDDSEDDTGMVVSYRRLCCII
jgi:hypothetical protein